MAARGRGGPTSLVLAPASAAALWGVAAALAFPVAAPAAGVPHIRHVFTIVLENEDADSSFGPSAPSPYLAATLPAGGALARNYHGIGHASLDNYLAMISGQPPNAETQADCPRFTEMLPGIVGADGVAIGEGCVYPPQAITVADQLQAAGRTWGGYMQDMGTSCRHPAPGAPDETLAARPGDQYATRHDPFVYFHSLIDSPACAAHVVDLGRLPADLASEASTPEYAFIAPDLCADGHDATCADGSSPGGYAGIDAFLREWVPRIEASPAFQDRGLIVVTFDESHTDASACCGEASGPNTPNNGGGLAGDGGGRVGAVLLSPCIAAGTVSEVPYNHYSYLRWVERNFSLGYLADAAAAAVGAFGTDLLNRPDCARRAKLTVRPRRARAGRRTRFRFRLAAELPLCREGVTIRFAGRRVRTDGEGRATVRARLRGRGRRPARAGSAICGATATAVRALPGARR